LHPAQGQWTEEEYLALPGNRLVEFTDGHVEVLPHPTEQHQAILGNLLLSLAEWASQGDFGRVMFAAFKVRLRPGKFRCPDISFMSSANAHRRSNQYWDRADLVMEVVSEKDPNRDLVAKQLEYAEARILEYWIVDPRTSQITVLTLAGDLYKEHAAFTRGQHATSATLDGFSVDVNAVFDVR
jgi:Uma2 family endonuclease